MKKVNVPPYTILQRWIEDRIQQALSAERAAAHQCRQCPCENHHAMWLRARGGLTLSRQFRGILKASWQKAKRKCEHAARVKLREAANDNR